MKPFFKWAGGKARLVPTILDILGKQPIGNYYEPFLGGGALFFQIWDRVGNAFLSDANRALIDTYRGVAADPRAVIESMRSLYAVPYEQIKERFNYQHPTETPLELKASRFLALNFLGFNGMWRVNRAGEFNVPIGRDSYHNPRQLSDYPAHDLLHCAMALAVAKIDCCDFRSIAGPEPQSRDLVFFDPPYLDTFDDYTPGGFGVAKHEALREQAKRYGRQGARVILCASDTELTRQVYGEPAIAVSLNRTIGASKRGACSELLYLY